MVLGGSPWLSGVSRDFPRLIYDSGVIYTFKVEEDIRLVVLEHLRHKLNIHVLDVDFL